MKKKIKLSYKKDSIKLTKKGEDLVKALTGIYYIGKKGKEDVNPKRNA